MDAQLQGQLDRIERALSQLTRSIGSYQPSSEHAKELVSANEALDQGILHLTAHQRNHERIQGLRETSSKLDGQLKNQLRSLADLRRSINAATLHTPLETTSSILASDVVDYGISIAKFQAPSTYKPPSAYRQQEPAASEAQARQPTAQASPEDTPTPLKAPGTAAASPEPNTPAVPQVVLPDAENAMQDQDENQAIRALSDEERATINPTTGQPFWPWVTEAMMEFSHLKQYQGKTQVVIARLEDEWNARNQVRAQNEQQPGPVGAAQPSTRMPGQPSQSTIPRPQTTTASVPPTAPKKEDPAVFDWDAD